VRSNLLYYYFMKQNLTTRRSFVKQFSLGITGVAFANTVLANTTNNNKGIVLSTWHNQGKDANPEAWSIVQQNGTSLDAVERAARLIESQASNCCVGLGGNPDRDGIVTLDACIMDHEANCGSVAGLEQIEHPISVARKVMEKTPHVMLVGAGAQQFAKEQGFEIKGLSLSDHAQKDFDNWKQKSEYKPQKNIEQENSKGPNAPAILESGEYNHDTIGIIAMDKFGNLSGACTTSGMAYKLHGRVGDSPIIGAGLYVDNEIGAATATGHGEEVIRICGCHLVVEFMRQGYTPNIACKKAVQRLIQKTKKELKTIQIGFIAINKKGEYGAYALNKGFDYTVSTNTMQHEKVVCESVM
jgi:N4-(beta-N-acetylglucosaminyl)-L-asparaginase